MNALLVEGAQRQLSRLEEARRSTPLGQRVVACAICYHLYDIRYGPDGETIIESQSHASDTHEAMRWPVEQVIVKLKVYIESLAS